MREGHWRCTTARVRSCKAAQGGASGTYERPQILTLSGDLDRLLVEQAALHRSLHAELGQQIGHERPTDLALFFERHTFGHLHCLLRFAASFPRLADDPDLEPFREPLPSDAPVLLRLRRRCVDRLAPVLAEPAASATVVDTLTPAPWPSAGGPVVGVRRSLGALTVALGRTPGSSGTVPTRPGADGTHPGPHAGLDPHAAEEARLGLADHDHLCVPRGHPELVQSMLGSLFHAFARHFDPLHALSSLSRLFRARPRMRLRGRRVLFFALSRFAVRRPLRRASGPGLPAPARTTV